MQDKKVETFRESHYLELTTSQDISTTHTIPVITADFPVLEMTASLEVKPGDPASASALQMFQDDLKARFQYKDHQVETTVEFSVSADTLPVQLTDSKQFEVKVYDPRFEDEAEGGFFRGPKEREVHLNIVKTFFASPQPLKEVNISEAITESTVNRSETGYTPTNTGYPPAMSGYPPANTGYPPHMTGYPPPMSGYPPPSSIYPSLPTAPPPPAYNDGLPPGWEQRTDSNTGKVYYLNHILKTTQWEKPEIKA